MKQIAQATATIWKNVQRGAQIGVLGTALVAAPLMGCANPSDGNTNTYEENGGNTNDNTNDNTGNNSGNTGNTGNSGNTNDNTGNSGNTNTGNNSGNTNTGNNNGNTNDNTGNTGNGGNTNDNTGNSGNTGTVTPEPEPSKQYGTPYDKTIGNGNYVLHNFISDEDNIENYVDVNHYLGLGETHIKDRATELDQAANGRTTYFNDFVNTVKDINRFAVNGGTNFANNGLDTASNMISYASAPIFADIIYKLKDEDAQYSFMDSYRVLANEAYKEGLGKSREYTGPDTLVYEKEKNSLIGDIALDNQVDGDINQVYATNDFTPITNTLDRLLAVAANEMNNGVTLQDLQKFVNLSLIPHSLKGMDNSTKGLLKHNECGMGYKLQESVMTDAIHGVYKSTALQAEDQTLTR